MISKPNIPETTNNRIFMVTQNNAQIDERATEGANLCFAEAARQLNESLPW